MSKIYEIFTSLDAQLGRKKPVAVDCISPIIDALKNEVIGSLFSTLKRIEKSTAQARPPLSYAAALANGTSPVTERQASPKELREIRIMYYIYDLTTFTRVCIISGSQLTTRHFTAQTSLFIFVTLLTSHYRSYVACRFVKFHKSFLSWRFVSRRNTVEPFGWTVAGLVPVHHRQYTCIAPQYATRARLIAQFNSPDSWISIYQFPLFLCYFVSDIKWFVFRSFVLILFFSVF